MNDKRTLPPKENPELPPDPAEDNSDDPGANVPAEIEAEVIEAIQTHVPAKMARPVSEAVLKVLHRSEIFQGPLPHPRHLKEYDIVLPGAAERIFKLAENEQVHRHNWENRHLTFDGIQGIGGQIIGAITLLAIIGAATYCAIAGYPWVATAFVSAGVISVITVLVQGRRLSGKSQPTGSAATPTRRKQSSKQASRRKR